MMSSIERPVRRIVIMGGGTAGWLTAGVLAARYRERGESGIDVTLVESPGRAPIGVGEGTWPTLRTTLRQMGVSETDFVRECGVSFKQGSHFIGWCHGGAESYLHPFMPPTGWEREALPPYWQEAPEERSFAEAVCPQTAPCLAGLAPKQITTPEYAGLVNYAYHINAGKLSEFLRRHCTEKLGVRHLLEEIVRVDSDAAGDVRALYASSGIAIEADLYVDCSGLSARIIGQHYGVPLLEQNRVLFVDRAWVTQAPHPRPDAPIASATLATAQRAGWVWDIGLPSRRGIGHAYASGYVSDDDALEQLHEYLGAHNLFTSELAFRKVTFVPGYRREFWVRNCVAVGLSAGFLEPLEASAIVMVELAAEMLANLLPRRRAAMEYAAKLFNETFAYRWRRVIEFLKLHYVLSSRTDSDFWHDNRSDWSVPAELRERLAFWQSQCPWRDDFQYRNEVFSAASYQYVLYGMGFATATPSWTLSVRGRAGAHEQFAQARQQAGELMSALPTNRDLLERINRFGLQRI